MAKILVALMQEEKVLDFLICQMKITLAFYLKNAYNSSCPSFMKKEGSPVNNTEGLTTCRSGNNSDEVTPVPIPNTAVKLISADGSWGFAPARVGRRQAF